MHSRLAPFNNICWRQLRQPFQPKACCLRFTVAELPRLNDLVGLANAARNHAYRVLNRNLRYWRIHQRLNEHQRLGLLLHLVFEPPASAYCQVRAGRVRNHQVPAHVQQFGHVAHVVRPCNLCRQQVATHGIVSKRQERIAHPSAVFASYQNSHAVLSRRTVTADFGP